MIDPKAEPIGNRNPYRRVDLAARRRPRTITREEIDDNIHRVPDADLYWCDPGGNYHLHEDQ
jgi:hypothetical protein